MRIFLTFASEQRDIADTILLALRNRGYDVFFSRDDLPPGDDFDARIQKAIAGSDLLVFLVSPESVTKGRYTLTELAFARDQWRSPRGRVLPVLVTPTPMASMPSYLKAVTLLEPEGNIAAETAAAVDRLYGTSRSRPILMFALLGVVTGVLSYVAFQNPFRFLMFSFLIQNPDKFDPKPTTVLPGMIFGLLVTACVYWYGARDRFLLPVAFGFTVLAWILAYDCTAVVYAQLDQFQKTKTLRMLSDDEPASSVSNAPASGASAESSSSAGNAPASGASAESSSSAGNAPASGADSSDNENSASSGRSKFSEEREHIPYLAGMSGIVGGLVGGFLTVFGVSIASQRFRRFEPWLSTILVATVLGTLLEVTRIAETFGFLALFTIWQSAVIALITRGMTPDTDRAGL